MNPLTSPWNKPRPVFITDKMLWYKWVAIQKHLTTKPAIWERNGYLQIADCCFVAKNSHKMRLISHLDWCYYEPQTLAQAIDNNQIESYYEIMLNDIRSDPNVWKDTDFELQLKTRYAVRAGRASAI